MICICVWINGRICKRVLKIITLNCGQTHTIPAGCHSGSGKVEAASLASQTAGTAAAADIARGKTAWINGVKVTGKASQAIEFDITSVMLEITNLTSGSLTINANGGRETLEPFETVSMPGINLLQGLDIAGGGTSYDCTLGRGNYRLEQRRMPSTIIRLDSRLCILTVKNTTVIRNKVKTEYPLSVLDQMVMWSLSSPVKTLV